MAWGGYIEVSDYPLRVADVKKVRIPNNLVKAMCGGKWPDDRGKWFQGFNFDAVDCWAIEGDELIPCDGSSDSASPCPGPNLKIVALEY